MLIIRRYSYDFLLFAGLTVFVCLKVKDIPTPYFWDELGVYAPAALHMKDAGTIGLMPADLEPLFSRGHPLLFTFCNALVFQIFGDSVFVGHVFSLFIACCTLIIFFYCSSNLFGKRTGFIASILLAAQPIFYANSCMILPEMMLTFFTVPSIWAIIKKRWGTYVLCASLAMLTKESAIVIPGAALLLLFMESLRKKDFFTVRRFRFFLLGTIPLMVFGVFLVIQKLQNGWFFFPEHIGYIQFSGLPDHLWSVLKDVFIGQSRWMLCIPVVGLIVVEYRNRLNSFFTHRKIATTAVFFLLALGFAAVNFYLLRYMLYIIPFVVLIGTRAIIVLTNRFFSKISMLLQLGFVLLFLYVVDKKRFNDTADMSYKHLVRAEQDCITWMEKQPWRDSFLRANFPVYQGLIDKRYGYLHGRPFNVSEKWDVSSKYFVFFYLYDGPIYPGGKIIKRFDNNYAHIVVLEF